MKKKIIKSIEIIIWIFFILIFNTISYFLEIDGLHMPKWVALLLRISTVIIDLFFVVYIRNIKIYYRKTFKKRLPKKTRSVFWLADTATLLLIFYSLYVCKVFLLFLVKAISLETFLYAVSGGFIIAIVFGRPISWFIKKYSRMMMIYFKRKIKPRIIKKK
ncbi:MAG: hypothetical protein WC875_04925 [Candidatus Absconditabacterales bacterium]